MNISGATWKDLNFENIITARKKYLEGGRPADPRVPPHSRVARSVLHPHLIICNKVEKFWSLLYIDVNSNFLENCSCNLKRFEFWKKNWLIGTELNWMSLERNTFNGGDILISEFLLDLELPELFFTFI